MYEQNKRVDEVYVQALREKYDVVMDEDVQALMRGEAD